MNYPYLRCYFTYRLHTSYQGTTQWGAFIDLSADELDPLVKIKVKLSQKWVKKQRTGHISEAISPTDFILSTKAQPIKVHSMTQVPMTLTKGCYFTHRLYHILYHSFLWLISALPSCTIWIEMKIVFKWYSYTPLILKYFDTLMQM